MKATKTGLNVIHFHRKPHGAYFSIERVFSSVREHLPSYIKCKVVVSRFESHGLIRRLSSMVEVAFRQGDINHVTGDVNFLVCFMSKRRCILTVHDLNLLQKFTGVRRWIYLHFWYVLPVMRSSYVTVISDKVKSELLFHVACNPAKVRVIHNPVPVGFQATPKEFNVNKPVILQVGTGENKNIVFLADSLERISCHLRIIGKLSIKQKMILKNRNVDYSAISGLSDEQVIIEYINCDMLVFVSTYEGFGMPIIEANAVGRPVVTSDLSPMSEVAGKAACLVNPSDINSIRSGVLRVIEDKPYRNELVRRGFDNVKRFEPSIIASKYAELYTELLKYG